MTQVSFDTPENIREFLFTIIESLPGGIVFADAEGNLLAVNRKAARLLGLKGSAIQNKTCWEVLSSGLRVSLDECARLHSPESRLLVEVQANESDQEKQFLLISRNELQSPFLHVSGFFLSIEDMTFPAVVESHLDRQKRFGGMQEMAAAMSQELKNPLGSLELYASILKRELAGDPDNERVANQMLGAVRTMDCLIDNFVAMSRLPQPQKTFFTISELFNDAATVLNDLAQKTSGMKLTIKNGCKETEFFADPALLKQLLVNLGVNGMESMASGGEVILSGGFVSPGGRQGDFLQLTVSDQGDGIQPENFTKIFDPFFSTRDHKKGLGLAVCHHIVDVHNGFIEVESEIGKGSIIKVFLPVVKSS